MGKALEIIERRFVGLDACELRADTESGRRLTGYAAVFNTETVIAGLWREEIASGAFAKTIKESDIRALWNHDPNILLGRNKAGTLQLSEDAHGLRSVIEAPDNEWGRPVVDAVKRGDVTGMSFAFRAVKQEWYWPERGTGELPKRTLREAQLFDVSPVTFPAFTSTSISARSAGIETAGDEDTDIIELARRLVRCGQRGYTLTDADREIVAAAEAILRNHLPQGEPVTHSLEPEIEPEPSWTHSIAARARELELLKLQYCGGTR